MQRKKLLVAAAILALALPFASDAQPRKPQDTKTSDRSETYQYLNLFGDVLERVRADYVDEVTDKDLIENAINGMLSQLDPHSSYMNAKAFRDMQVDTRGEFGGLGIEVTMENGVVKVVTPFDDSPAGKAGLQPNDLIIALDNEPVQGLTLAEAVDKMRGKVGTPIKLTVKRGTKDPFEVTLKRAVIKVKAVRYNLEGGDVGYIRLTQFTEQADSGIKDAVENLKKQAGNKLRGFVLDLRNNPGGLLDQAVAVSDDFLERGEIVSTRARRPEDGSRFNAKPGDITGGLPLVVLINGGSASASEIVAGALQDHHRAVLLGTRSFGKGSVQTIIPVAGGGAMRLTTARYYTPSGRSIQAKGIDPDIIVEQSKVEPLNQSSFPREENLKGALPNPNAVKPGATPGTIPGKPPMDPNKPDPTKPGDSSKTTPAPDATKPADTKPPSDNADNKPVAPTDAADDTKAPKAAEDYQLARAVDLIRGISLYTQRGN
jgi:carboxyl-terminal processing protease